MSNPSITLTGRLAADPELKVTPAGVAVTNLTIATSDRRKTDAGEWEDVDASFWRCTAFRQLAETIAADLHKGQAVVATGKVKQRNYETREGEKRTATEITLDAIGPDLRWASKSGDGWSKQQQSANDPWATPQQSTSQWGGPSSERAPY